LECRTRHPHYATHSGGCCVCCRVHTRLLAAIRDPRAIAVNCVASCTPAGHRLSEIIGSYTGDSVDRRTFQRNLCGPYWSLCVCDPRILATERTDAAKARWPARDTGVQIANTGFYDGAVGATDGYADITLWGCQTRTRNEYRTGCAQLLAYDRFFAHVARSQSRAPSCWYQNWASPAA
jgi:hypothetical protein